MFSFFTNLFEIAYSVMDAASSLFAGAFFLLGWLVDALSQGFEFAYYIMGMLPYQLIYAAIYPILILIVFNIINFIKGWI